MAGKSLAFDIKINGVGLGQKELDSIEKGAKKAKTAVDDLTKAWKSNENEIENMARKQAQVASAERRFNKAAKDELKAENEIRKTNSAIRKKQVQDAIEADSKQKRSIEGLRLIVRDLRKEYNQLSEDQLNNRGGKAMLKQLQQEEALLQKREGAYGLRARNVGNYPGQQIASNLTGGLIGNGAAAGAAVAVTAVVALTKQLIDLNVEIDTLQANVRKTTGLNTQQVENLTERLRGLDTTTTLQDLLKIAEDAGRFGVTGEKSIGDFTEAVEILNVALGDEFGGGVEEITNKLSSLSTLFYGLTNDGTVLAERFLHIGNALNALAADGNASANGITDIATRIAGTSKTFGFTESQILGISAAIESMGINAERGAGGFNTLNKRIRSNVTDISATIGIAEKDLTKLLDTKPYEAMTTVINGLFKASKGSPTELSGILKDVKLSGEGVADIVFNFARQNDLLNRSLAVSEVNLPNVTSLTNEYGNQMESAGAKITLLKNALSDVFISENGQSVVGRWADTFRLLLDQADSFGDQLIGVSAAVTNFSTLGLSGATDDYTRNRLKTQAQKNAEAEAIRQQAALREQRIIGLSQGKTGIEQFANAQAPNLLSFFVDPNAKTPLTKEQIAELKRAAKEAARIAKQEAERLEKERIAKGEAGSVTFITKDISDLKQLMDRTYDSKLLSGYALQLDALNTKLEEAQLRTRVLTSKALNKKNGNDDLLGILPSRINIGNVEQLNPDDAGVGKFAEGIKGVQAAADKIRDDENKKDSEFRSQIYDQAVESAYTTFDAIAEIENNYYDRKKDKALQRLDEEYKEKFEAIKGNNTLEIALQKELDAKKEAIEKKEFKRQQNQAILLANINGALGLISAFKNGFLAGLPAAIGIAVNTAAQIAIIKSQKFAKGGFTGYGTGQRDETGHIPVGTVHDGEWVGNKKFVTENPSLFNYLERVQANKYRPFASGGFTSPQLPIPQVFNSIDQANSVNGGSRFSRQELMELKAVLFEGTYQGTYLGGDEKHRQAERNNLAVKNSQR